MVVHFIYSILRNYKNGNFNVIFINSFLKHPFDEECFYALVELFSTIFVEKVFYNKYGDKDESENI